MQCLASFCKILSEEPKTCNSIPGPFQQSHKTTWSNKQDRACKDDDSAALEMSVVEYRQMNVEFEE